MKSKKYQYIYDQNTSMATIQKKLQGFPLRFTKKDTYNKLKKEAKLKPGKCSVNSLINIIIEEHQKKDLVISE